MEKIKVNMTPIEEVKTIHASQNDNATRKWAFDLYDENGKIDSSDIKEQMIFDSRVGGTEQILPENGSDPTTSPIIADIQYPDSLRSEQTFLYRESPTTVNGQAKITHIKGNTLVWNQLVQNGNFADTSNWSTGNARGTISASNNVLSYTLVQKADSGNYVQNRIQQNIELSNGHKNIVSVEVKCPRQTTVYLRNGNQEGDFSSLVSANVWTRLTQVGTKANSTPLTIFFNFDSYELGENVEIRNMMCTDLTQLNNSAITDASSFRTYYNLPYYAYTQGKLLPFKGESLKTVGKNFYQQVTWYRNNSNSVDVKDNNNNARIKSDVFSLKKGTYVVSGYPSGTNPIALRCYDVNYNLVESPSFTNDVVELTEGAIEYGSMLFGGSGFTSDTNTLFYNANIQLESGSTATSYEPYTSSTINLPTLNYFPTGMKSAGSVFDEITESKATTRIGSVDLGTLDWTAFPTTTSNVYRMRSTNLASIIKPSPNDNTKANIVCAIYPTRTPGDSYANPDTNGISIGTTGNIFVNDGNYNTSSSASAFKTAMSGVYLYYELATPTEESITTASLVTEKGEAPLYYDNELIADCNEVISAESGIFDAKIKLMDDNVIYSQKIQLHVERKPQ